MFGWQSWEEVTDRLKFAWVTEGQAADINVFFAFIDGKHGVVGKASDPSPDTPQATWLRLDSQENWSAKEFPSGTEGKYDCCLVYEEGKIVRIFVFLSFIWTDSVRML